jgi:large subunit ribosomal protein L25
MTFELQTQSRDARVDLEALRLEGNIPAVFYGAGAESTPITLNYNDFVKVYREAGESTMITLKTGAGNKQALVQDMQQDAVSGKVIHVDFKIIEAGKPIIVTIPLEFVGQSAAVKANLGSLNKVLHEVEIEVLPKDLPSSLDVDLTLLDQPDSQILAKDIKLPAGELITDPESVVAVISAAREESDETNTDIDFSQIQVQKKGKEEKPE